MLIEEIKAELLKMQDSYNTASKALEDLDEKQVVEALKGFEKLRSLNDQMSKKIQKFIEENTGFDADSEKPAYVFNIAMLSEEISKMNDAATRLATNLRLRFESAEAELKHTSAIHASQMEQLENIQSLMQQTVKMPPTPSERN